MYQESEQCYTGARGDPPSQVIFSIHKVNPFQKSPKWYGHETVYTTTLAIQGYYTGEAHIDSTMQGGTEIKKTQTTFQLQNTKY